MKRLGALPVLLWLLPSLSCVERQVDGPESDLLPVCMLYPARGWDEHGDATLMVASDGSTGRTCDCMTQEEFEQDLRVDEFHERALEECLQLAASFETNDCQEVYDEGGWLLLMLPAVGDNAWLTMGKELDCAEDDAADGCATAGAPSSTLGLFALLLILSTLISRRLRTHE